MTSCRTILAGLALVLLALVAVGSRPAHALDPNDPNSVRTGMGLFRTEVYLMKLLGFDVAGFSSAQLSHAV